VRIRINGMCGFDANTLFDIFGLTRTPVERRSARQFASLRHFGSQIA
jgi:hypothetical protein